MSQGTCIICSEPFLRGPKSRRRTCGRSCAVSLAWQKNPEDRKAGISAAQMRPDQQKRIAEHNARRWAKPEEHEKLSEQNRERWTDGKVKAESAAVRKRTWTLDRRLAFSDQLVRTRNAATGGKMAATEIYVRPLNDVTIPAEVAPPLPSVPAIATMSDTEVEAVFIHLRWPDGVRCPKCGSAEHYKIALPKLWKCRKCAWQFTTFSGTIFASRKTAPRIILSALSMAQAGNGSVVALRVAGELGISYKSAYVLCRKAQEFLLNGIEGRSKVAGYWQKDHKSIRPNFIFNAGDAQKTCASCGQEKEADEFPHRPGRSYLWGLRAKICKECLKASRSASQSETLAKRRARRAKAMVKPHSATELLNRGARYPGAYWHNMRTWWTSQEKADLATLVSAAVPVEKAADILGRSPKSISWQARDLVGALPRDWSKLITKPRLIVPVRPRLLAYPYLPELPRSGDSGAELIMAVNRAIPAYLPDHIRADLAQEAILAILAGEMTLEELAHGGLSRLRKRSLVDGHFGDSSLEAALRPDDDRTTLDVRLPPGVMEKLQW